MRAEEAVPVLAKAFREIPVPGMIREPSFYDFPFTRALVKIGRASIPALIEIASTSEKKKEQREVFFMLEDIWAVRQTPWNCWRR